MIALVLFIQVNLAVLERQANEGIDAAQSYTAAEMDIWGRNRLRTESNVVLWLLEELDRTKGKLESCTEMQERVRREP